MDSESANAAEPVGSLHDRFIYTLRTIIHIANPVPGGQRYTSAKRARHFLLSGRAEMTKEGLLFFVDSPTLVKRRADEALDREIATYRSGVIYWNGATGARQMHRPGEARS